MEDLLLLEYRRARPFPCFRSIRITPISMSAGPTNTASMGSSSPPMQASANSAIPVQMRLSSTGVDCRLLAFSDL